MPGSMAWAAPYEAAYVNEAAAGRRWARKQDPYTERVSPARSTNAASRSPSKAARTRLAMSRISCSSAPIRSSAIVSSSRSAGRHAGYGLPATT